MIVFVVSTGVGQTTAYPIEGNKIFFGVAKKVQVGAGLRLCHPIPTERERVPKGLGTPSHRMGNTYSAQ